jgi:hypothetical protein
MRRRKIKPAILGEKPSFFGDLYRFIRHFGISAFETADLHAV